MRVLLTGIVLVLALCAGGCGPKARVLGKLAKERSSTILAINAGDAPHRLTLEGTMIEKCPQAGCWFRLDDGTGVIKVDTKDAGFVVTQVPLNTKVKVAGLIQQEGDEVQLRATGLTY
jgi:uncharacterized protein YdeI (BOF family)